ncbi:MAG: rRNA pseudouridine synthase [candidate division Zixibacteria bacterium]|nr:rRNA pseudouridine synthase [candidate division Zixibacteria bacterium]
MNRETPAALERLNRYLARAGVGSRRRADHLIAAGRVTINGVVVERLATMVDPYADKVTLDGKPMRPSDQEAVWILLNKKAGTLSARRDARGRATIFNTLPAEWRHLIPVGRLDLDTEGVILLTSDGDAANRLMHPRYEIKRVYEAEVAGVPATEQLQHLARGVDLGDPTPARASVQVTGHHHGGAVIRLTLREGRKREVKRMLLAVGHRVRRLCRISFAGLTARGLDSGQWRRLTPTEIARLTKAP